MPTNDEILEKYPYLRDFSQKAFDEGFSPDDIENVVKKITSDELKAGFTQEEIDKSITGAGGDSYLKTIAKAAMQGATGLPRYAESAVSAGLELAGVSQEGVERPFKEAAEYWEPETRTYGQRTLANTVRSMAEFGTIAAVVSPIAGTAGVLSIFGGGAGAEKYEQARREGASKLAAVGAGVVTGGFEAGTEAVPLGILTKPGLKYVSRLLKGAAADLIGEEITTLGEMAIADEAILGKKWSGKQYKQAMADTALVSLGSTFGMTTISHPLVRRYAKAAEIGDETSYKKAVEEINNLPPEEKARVESDMMDIKKQVLAAIKVSQETEGVNEFDEKLSQARDEAVKATIETKVDEVKLVEKDIARVKGLSIEAQNTFDYLASIPSPPPLETITAEPIVGTSIAKPVVETVKLTDTTISTAEPPKLPRRETPIEGLTPEELAAPLSEKARREVGTVIEVKSDIDPQAVLTFLDTLALLKPSQLQSRHKILAELLQAKGYVDTEISNVIDSIFSIKEEGGVPISEIDKAIVGIINSSVAKNRALLKKFRSEQRLLKKELTTEKVVEEKKALEDVSFKEEIISTKKIETNIIDEQVDIVSRLKKFTPDDIQVFVDLANADGFTRTKVTPEHISKSVSRIIEEDGFPISEIDNFVVKALKRDPKINEKILQQYKTDQRIKPSLVATTTEGLGTPGEINGDLLDELNSENDTYPDDTELYSGFPVHKMWDFARGLMEPVSGRVGGFTKEKLGNINLFMRQKLRVPFWGDMKDLVLNLHRGLERGPHEATFIARIQTDIFKNIKDKKIKNQVSKVLFEGDRLEIEFDDVQLAERGLNPEGIQAYHSVRSALDYLIFGYTRQLYIEHRGRVISEGDIIEKSGLSEAEYNKLSSQEKAETKNRVLENEAIKFLTDIYKSGYIPHYRFGRYIVTLYKDGKIVASEGYDTKRDADASLKEAMLKDEFDSKLSRVIDTKREFSDYKEMMAMIRFIPAISKVLKKSGVEYIDVNNAMSLISSQYAMGKLARRKGIAGYSENLDKILDTYITNFPKAMAKRFTADLYASMIREMPKDKQKYAKDLVDYNYGRIWKEGKLNIWARTGIYMHYLMLKPAFAVMNLTQRVTMTLPWTVAEVRRMGVVNNKPLGVIEATKQSWQRLLDGQITEIQLLKDISSAAARQIAGGKRVGLVDIFNNAPYLEQYQKDVLGHLYRQGELKELKQLELTAGSQFLRWLDIFGVLSERSNRIHAALIGSTLYYESGFRGQALTELTDEFIHSTQILYSKTNRPEMSRGMLAPVMMFKSWILNYVNMASVLYKTDKAAFGNMVAVMMVLGGLASAIPDEVSDAVDLLMKKLYGDDWPLVRRGIERKLNNNKMARAAIHGIPALVGIDASATMGVGEFTGSPLVPLYQGSSNLLKSLYRSDIPTMEKYKYIMPSQIKKVYTFYNLTKYGTLTNKYGVPYVTRADIMELPIQTRLAGLEMYDNLPKEWSVATKMETLLGFPTIAVSEYYKDINSIRDVSYKLTDRKRQMGWEFARAIHNNDKKTVERLTNESEKTGIVPNTETIVKHLWEFNELGGGR